MEWIGLKGAMKLAAEVAVPTEWNGKAFKKMNFSYFYGEWEISVIYRKEFFNLIFNFTSHHDDERQGDTMMPHIH